MQRNPASCQVPPPNLPTMREKSRMLEIDQVFLTFYKALTPTCGGRGRNVAPTMHQKWLVLQYTHGDAFPPTLANAPSLSILHLHGMHSGPDLGPVPGTAGAGALGGPIQVHGEVRPSSRALKLSPQLLQNRFHWAQPLQIIPQ